MGVQVMSNKTLDATMSFGSSRGVKFREQLLAVRLFSQQGTHFLSCSGCMLKVVVRIGLFHNEIAEHKS